MACPPDRHIMEPSEGVMLSARDRSPLVRSRNRAGLLMTLPAFLLVAFALGIPIIQAGYYSMTDWNGITATWIGPSAYWKELTSPTFWRVIENNALLLP